MPLAQPSVRRWPVWVLLVALLFAGLPAQAAAAQPVLPPALLIPAPTQAHTPDSAAGGRFTANPAALAALSAASAEAPARLALPLPPALAGEAAVATLRPAGAALYTGALEGQPGSSVTLAAGGTLAGVVSNAAGVFTLANDGAGQYHWQERAWSDFPDEAPPLAPPPGLVEALPSEPQAPAFPAPAPEGTQADANPIIDVLVVYTPAARTYAQFRGGIDSLVQIAVTETNQGYANSGVNQRIRLVDAREVALAESQYVWSSGPGNHWEAMLVGLTQPGDKLLDEVQPLRNSTGADVVVLLVEGATQTGYGYCGMSWLMAPARIEFEDMAYSIVRTDCATGYFTFAHEMGHVMGSTHERPNTPGAYDFSYGYQDPGGAFRTIMAYDCPGGCQRVNFWSNTTALLNGRPMGAAQGAANAANNALSLNLTSKFVSAFRQRAITPLAANGLTAARIAETEVDLSWNDPNEDESGYQVLRAAGSAAFAPVAQVNANATAFRDSGLTCATAYRYQVRTLVEGLPGPVSLELAVTTGACTPPAVVGSVKAAPLSGDAIRVLWADTPNETSYRVERSADGGQTWTAAGTAPANTTQFVDRGLALGQSYLYAVRAINPLGQSSPSSFANARTFRYAIFLSNLLR